MIKKNKKAEKTLVAAPKVTNDTLEKHRQEVLKKGKKFKYPVQYSKHKLVINAIIVAVLVAVIGTIVGWFQLYVAQNTSDFMFRVTLTVPVPVANIDGENVLYSDYLAQYRSNISVTEKQEGSLKNKEDEERRSNYYKRQSMDNSILNAYAVKLARENNITVTSEEIENIFNEHRKTRNAEISETAFNKIIEDNYRLSPAEYRRMFIELPLLKQKVSAKIDENARGKKDQIYAELKKNGGDFDKIQEKFGKEVEISSPGVVKSTNIDGGRTEAALKLKKGEVSEPFMSKSGDGYYIVKLLEKKDDEVSYSYIKIPFKEFVNRVEALKKDGKVKEHIKLEN